MDIATITTTLDKIVRGALWEGSGCSTQIEFANTVQILNTELDWDLNYNQTSDLVTLSLFNDDFLWARLELKPTGVFLGRCRIKGVGSFQLKCPQFHSMLKELSSPKKAIAKGNIVPKKPSVHYDQDVGARFHLPYFNLHDDRPNLKMYTHLPAIALIACNRPDYFKKVVQALAKNKVDGKSVTSWPTVLFIDKPYDAEHEHYKIDDQVLEFKKTFPRGAIVQRPVHYGCGRNIIDARRQLFDNVGFDRVYVFEDDLVPSPQYIQLCENIWEWADRCGYGDVGAVQGWEWCELSNLGRERYLNYVRATMSNWWGYSMSKQCWDDISPLIYKYEEQFLFGLYGGRPHKAILKRFKEWSDNVEVSSDITDYPLQADFNKWRTRYVSGPPTGQDGVTMLTMDYRGWRRLAPVVNRSEYIGKTGIHMNPALWGKHGYDKILYREYEDDMIRTEFDPQVHFTDDPGIEESDKVPGFNLVNLI